MPKRAAFDAAAPFQTIDNAARITGLSRDFIRTGVKAGRIAYVRNGGSNAAYMISMPRLLAQLDAEAAANCGAGSV